MNGNFKMKCVKKHGGDYQEGKIYEVINGKWFTDEGIAMGHQDAIKTIDDVSKISGAEWELIEENPAVDHMKKVAEMLDLELDEEFNIIEKGGSLFYSPYKITERGLIDKTHTIRDDRLGDLLRGIYSVQKLPWKPKDGDVFWAICDGSIHVYAFSSSHSSDVALYKCGWMFRTEQEAEANKERVLAEMKEVIGE